MTRTHFETQKELEPSTPIFSKPGLTQKLQRDRKARFGLMGIHHRVIECA